MAGARKRAKQAQKCQRPRTEGAGTSGAAELFRGRPSAGAMKHRRRRWMLAGDDRGASQGGRVRSTRPGPRGPFLRGTVHNRRGLGSYNWSWEGGMDDGKEEKSV